MVPGRHRSNLDALREASREGRVPDLDKPNGYHGQEVAFLQLPHNFYPGSSNYPLAAILSADLVHTLDHNPMLNHESQMKADCIRLRASLLAQDRCDGLHIAGEDRQSVCLSFSSHGR